MTLATEQPTESTEDRRAPETGLETWSHNERMRHVPPISWIAQKLDGDLRRRIDTLLGVYTRTPPGDPHHAPMEQELRAICRSIDRVGEIARRGRANHQHPPNELGARLSWAISHTVTNLNAADAETFGRRLPFHTFERSSAEPLWAATLSVIDHVRRLTELARELDRGIDERLYEGLATLQPPLDPRPIA